MFTLHIYSSSKTAPLCKMLKQSENESWRITHLAIGSHIWSLFAPIHMQYMVIICPNSHEKLTKSEIRSSSNRLENCSESLI